MGERQGDGALGEGLYVERLPGTFALERRRNLRGIRRRYSDAFVVSIGWRQDYDGIQRGALVSSFIFLLLINIS